MLQFTLWHRGKSLLVTRLLAFQLHQDLSGQLSAECTLESPLELARLLTAGDWLEYEIAQPPLRLRRPAIITAWRQQSAQQYQLQLGSPVADWDTERKTQPWVDTDALTILQTLVARYRHPFALCPQLRQPPRPRRLWWQWQESDAQFFFRVLSEQGWHCRWRYQEPGWQAEIGDHFAASRAWHWPALRYSAPDGPGILQVRAVQCRQPESLWLHDACDPDVAEDCGDYQPVRNARSGVAVGSNGSGAKKAAALKHWRCSPDANAKALPAMPCKPNS